MHISNINVISLFQETTRKDLTEKDTTAMVECAIFFLTVGGQYQNSGTIFFFFKLVVPLIVVPVSLGEIQASYTIF